MKYKLKVEVVIQSIRLKCEGFEVELVAGNICFGCLATILPVFDYVCAAARGPLGS